MIKFFYLTIISCIFLSVSCKKDPPLYPDELIPIDPGNGGDGSIGGGSYQPVTKGSYWVYTAEINGLDQSSTTTLNGNKKTIGGRSYYEAESISTLAGDKQYAYYYTGDHIYTLRSRTLYGDIDIELEYLNDTASVGYTWTRAATIDDLAAKIIGTIAEKNISRTVGSKVFSNVTHTTLQIRYDLMGDYEFNNSYQFYIAKNVGVIEIDSEISMGDFNYTQVTLLKDYSIK